MSREEIIKITMENINQLSDKRIQEVADYVSALASKIDDEILNNEIKIHLTTSNNYDFLIDVEELYQVNDISIGQEIKDLLDERRTTSQKEDFLPWEEAKKQIHFESKK